MFIMERAYDERWWCIILESFKRWIKIIEFYTIQTIFTKKYSIAAVKNVILILAVFYKTI